MQAFPAQTRKRTRRRRLWNELFSSGKQSKTVAKSFEIIADIMIVPAPIY